MGKGISHKHREQVRPFAAPIGDLIDEFHGRVFEMSAESLELLAESIRATLAATGDHASGKFYHAARILEPLVRSAVQERLLAGGDVEALKAAWDRDRSWKLEDTPGFSAFRKELREYAETREVGVGVAERLRALEARVESLERSR